MNQNLNYLLKLFKMDLKSLSIETGVPIATISRIKQENSNPTLGSIEPLADFFRVNVHEMIYENMSNKDYQRKKEIGAVVHIPIITMEEVTRWPCPSKIIKFIASAGINNKNAFGIQVENEVMAPAFQNGSIVIIDPDLEPREGDYVICFLDGENIPVFRQIFIDGKNYFFRPVNSNYGSLKEYTKFKIKGVIIKSIEDFR